MTTEELGQSKMPTNSRASPRRFQTIVRRSRFLARRQASVLIVASIAVVAAVSATLPSITAAFGGSDQAVSGPSDRVNSGQGGNGRSDPNAVARCSWEEQIRPWLTRIVTSIGAPEGHPVSPGQLRDTGTGLQIMLDEFQGRFTAVYVTADSQQDAENANTEGMTPISREGDFLIFRKRLDHSDVLIAQGQSTSWTISLGAYSDDRSLRWKEDQAPTRWMSQAVDEAEQSPFPSC